MMRQLSLYLAILAVALAPLPFGSVDNAWISIWCLMLAGSVASVSLRELRAAHAYLLAPVLVLLMGLILAVWLQTRPSPIVGEPNGLWHRAREILDPLVPVYVSADAGRPWVSLGAPLAMFLGFIAAFLNATDRGRARLLLGAIALSSVAYAAYGILAHMIDPTSLLWVEKRVFLGSVTGTFINRNTAATFFGTGAIVWLLASLEILRNGLPRNELTLSGIGAAILDGRSPKLIASLSCLLCMLIALLMTQSRAGILLSLAALLASGGLYLRQTLPLRAKSPLAVAALTCIAVFLFESWGGGVAYRLGTQGLTDAARWEGYRSVLAIIRDYPALGSGLGTFDEVFPAYRSSDLSIVGIWDRAHNSLLETAAELGVPAAAAIVLLWLLIGTRLLIGALKRRKDAILPLAALGGGLLGTAHTMVDFPLQIPGYAIIFSALVGCGYAQSLRTPESERQPPAGSPIAKQ